MEFFVQPLGPKRAHIGRIPCRGPHDKDHKMLGSMQQHTMQEGRITPEEYLPYCSLHVVSPFTQVEDFCLKVVPC